MSELQRGRVLAAIVEVVDDGGVEGASVARVIKLARVSRKTFYLLFENRSQCLLAAIERTVALARERAEGAYRAEEDWAARTRAGLAALLEFFDEEPQLARLLVVHSQTTDPATHRRRGETLGALAGILDAGRHDALKPPSPLTAECLVSGVVEALRSRLLKPRHARLAELVNPIMSLIVLPYLGEMAAREELQRPFTTKAARRRRRGSADPLHAAGMRLTYRTVRVLGIIALQGGLSNAQIGERAEIADAGQASKLLGRLARLGLAENTGKGKPHSARNAWRLTARGHELTRSMNWSLPDEWP